MYKFPAHFAGSEFFCVKLQLTNMSGFLQRFLTLCARDSSGKEDVDGIEFTEHPAVRPTNAQPKNEATTHIRTDRPAGAQAAIARPSSSGVASSDISHAPRYARQPSNDNRLEQLSDPDTIAPVLPKTASTNIANLLEDRRLMFARLRNPQGPGTDANARSPPLTNGLPN